MAPLVLKMPNVGNYDLRGPGTDMSKPQAKHHRIHIVHARSVPVGFCVVDLTFFSALAFFFTFVLR